MQSRFLRSAAAAAFLAVQAVASAGDTDAREPESAANAPTVQLIGAPQFRSELAALRGRVVIVNLWAT